MMNEATTVYEVVITEPRIGFPRGVWMRVNFRAMADGIVFRLLRDDGVVAEVRDEVSRG